MSTEPIRSFAARVINLCYEIEGACTLTHIKSLGLVAKQLIIEAQQVQSIYGGHPSKPPKSPDVPASKSKPTAKKTSKKNTRSK